MVVYAAIFGSEGSAEAAHQKLVNEGIAGEDRLLLKSGSDVKSATATDKGQELLEGISGRVGDAVAQGKAVLVLNVRLGAGGRGEAILRESGYERMLEGGIKRTHFLSDAFGLPLITRRKNKQTFGAAVTEPNYHVTGGLISKGHITGSLLSKSHITPNLISESHITGGLVTRDQKHFTEVMPLVVKESEKK